MRKKNFKIQILAGKTDWEWVKSHISKTLVVGREQALLSCRPVIVLKQDRWDFW